MDDESYIALVYAHAEGNRRNNHLNIVVHPVALNGGPSLDGEVCMVKVARDPMVALEVLGELLAVFP